MCVQGTACLALLWTSPAIPLVLGVPLQGLGLMCIAGFASTVGDYLWIAAVSMAPASVLVRPTRKFLRGRFSAARSVSFANPVSLASSVSFADERCRLCADAVPVRDVPVGVHARAAAL